MEKGIYHQIFHHSDGCKCLLTRKLSDCHCDPDIELVKSPSPEFSFKLFQNDLKEYKKEVSKYN